MDDASDHNRGNPPDVEDALFGDVAALIENARRQVATRINSELVLLYWGIGKRVREEILGGERAEYGKQVVKRLGERLTQRYGRGYGWQNLFRMIKFAEFYPDPQIFSPLARKLTWTLVAEVLTVDDDTKRNFYLSMAAHEQWSKRTLRAKIQDKLYERTVLARGPASGIEAEIADLREKGITTADLAFRDPYVLDFLGLDPRHSEADLERAIIDDMQRFLLELGADFTFVARQKRITVDGRDYHLDLLFFHRGMRCLVAIELKTRRLEPGDKGQMELYLRWLDAYERRPQEEAPVGIILCSEKGPEQVALLGLDHGEIRAARYLTDSVREEMQHRLAAAVKALPEAEVE